MHIFIKNKGDNMFYCRKRLWSLLLLFLGIGLTAGAFLSFWLSLVIGIGLIGAGIYINMNS